MKDICVYEYEHENICQYFIYTHCMYVYKRWTKYLSRAASLCPDPQGDPLREVIRGDGIWPSHPLPIGLTHNLSA